MNKFAFVFSGQASQYIGMGKKNYHEYKFVRDLYEEASDRLSLPMDRICFEPSEFDLNKTIYTQPSVFLTDLAILRVLQHETDIKPSYVAGHSLGEYAALSANGVISFSDALSLVSKRSKYMDEAGEKNNGQMYAISNCDLDTIEEQLKKVKGLVTIACYNGSSQFVISGEQDNISEAAEMLKSAGANTMRLNVSAAFHSPLMSTAAHLLSKDLYRTKFHQPCCPVISNVYARPYVYHEIAKTLILQMTSPVRWRSTISFLARNDITHIIEVGPGEVLKKLIVREKTKMQVLAYDHDEDRKAIRQISLLEDQVNLRSCQSRMVSLIDYSIALLVSTPNNNHQMSTYDEEVRNKMQEISQMKEMMISEPQVWQQYLVLLGLYQNVLMIKDVTLAETQQRNNELERYAKSLQLI